MAKEQLKGRGGGGFNSDAKGLNEEILLDVVNKF